MKYIVLLLIVLTFASCRKKIEHTPGENSYTFYENTSGSGGGGSTIELDWNIQTSSDISELFALELFNGELYVAGAYENSAGDIKAFGKLDGQGNIINALSKPISGTVYDLFTYNNELIIGGGYLISNSPMAYDLIRMNSTGQITDIPFTSSAAHQVRRIGEFNGNLIIGGTFTPQTNNSVLTSNVEMLSNYNAVGLSNLYGPITGQAVHDGELYVCGKNGKLYKWTGSDWTIVSYIDESSSLAGNIYGIASYNSELFILGEFLNNYFVKKMDAQGVWENIDPIYQLGSFSEYSGIKVVNNELFIFGSGFKFETGPTTGIMKYNGSYWSRVGEFPYTVRDVEFYNNHLYIASNYGLFKYE